MGPASSCLEEKISDYLTAGTRLIWIVDPDKRRVAVYSSGNPTRWLEDGGVIDGDDVLPELIIPVGDFFEGLAPKLA
jgi:Uma2 family endonuclease